MPQLESPGSRASAQESLCSEARGSRPVVQGLVLAAKSLPAAGAAPATTTVVDALVVEAFLVAASLASVGSEYLMKRREFPPRFHPSLLRQGARSVGTTYCALPIERSLGRLCGLVSIAGRL